MPAAPVGLLLSRAAARTPAITARTGMSRTLRLPMSIFPALIMLLRSAWMLARGIWCWCTERVIKSFRLFPHDSATDKPLK